MARKPKAAAKKKPRGKPFVKGDQRINRAGVPREAVEFQNALRVAFAEELDRPHPMTVGPDGQPVKGMAPRSNFVSIIRRVVELAAAGQPWAIEMIFDRVGGKVVQPVSGPNDGPMRYLIDIARPEREQMIQ